MPLLLNIPSQITSVKTVLFNYSIGESMKWALGEWIPLKEMQKEVSSERFINTKFGDVYSKVES